MRVVSKVLLVGLLTLSGMQCQSPSSISGEQDTMETGQVTVFLPTTPGTPFSKIAHSAELRISASDMSALETVLEVGEESIAGVVSGIPAGSSRLFEVLVYDSVEQLQYYGSAFVDIIPDSIVNVRILASRLEGSALISVIIDEGGSSPTMDGFAYYPFDGNLENFGYSGIDARSFGELTWVPQGVSGSALAYDQNPGYVVIDSLFPSRTPSATMMCWVQPNDSVTPQPVFEFSDSTGNAGLHLWINSYGWGRSSPGAIQANLRNHSNEDTHNVYSRSNHIPCGGQWTHIALAFDSTSARVLVNAQVVAEAEFEPFSPRTNVPLYVGFRPAGSSDIMPGRNFRGNIDEVRVYKENLSNTEIAEIYAFSR